LFIRSVQNETIKLLNEFTQAKVALFSEVLLVVQKYDQKVHQYQEALFNQILKLDAVNVQDAELRLKRRVLIEEIQRAMDELKACELIELPLIKKTPLKSPLYAQPGVGASCIRNLSAPKPNNKLMIVRC